MKDSNAEKILRILRHTFSIPTWQTSKGDPFRTLIVTMISQNTNDKNTARAFENLSKKVRIDPETLAKTETGLIEDCLRVAGLYRNKAKAIKQLSRVILEKHAGDIRQILSMPFEDARKELMQLPSIGPKTADVVLLFSGGRPTVPVDTHVDRVSKRLGLVNKNADYEAVRGTLQSLYNPRDYLSVHVLLILQGRRYCKARAPLCDKCPLSSLCPSKQLWI